MARRIKLEYTQIVAVVMIVFMIMAVVFLGDQLGLDPTTPTILSNLIPGLFTILISIIILSTIKDRLYYLPALGILGFGLAILIEEMYDAALLNLTMFSGLTIGQVQIWCIVLGILAGGFAAYGGR